MAPIQQINESEPIEHTDLWKTFYPKMIDEYDLYDIDDYDDDRDDLNDDFIKNVTIYDYRWFDDDVFDMIKKDCLVIQNWIVKRNDEEGLDDIPFNKMNTERKIFGLFMYWLCYDIKIVD